MTTKTTKILWGILVANVFAIVIVGISTLSFNSVKEPVSSILIYSNFILVPFFMGTICAYYWRELQLRTWSYIGWSVVNTLVSMIFTFFLFREGLFCLIIVGPIILVFIVTGTLIGRVIFKRKNNILKSSVFGILLIAFIVDSLSDHENINMVSDTMIVHAPIEKVWPLVVEYEPITAEESYWFFAIGLPSPVQSTVDGYHVGAGRKCIFSNGYIFEEKMVVFKPNEELTFDITEQPRDPEIMGHIDILRGQFILKDNGDGTTTMIGNSWYRLYVFPGWYFNIWSKSITRNVHLRVMEHIKILSEKDV